MPAFGADYYRSLAAQYDAEATAAYDEMGRVWDTENQGPWNAASMRHQNAIRQRDYYRGLANTASEAGDGIDAIDPDAQRRSRKLRDRSAFRIEPEDAFSGVGLSVPSGY